MHICIDDVLFPNPDNNGYNITISNNLYKLLLDVCHYRDIKISFAYSTAFLDLKFVPKSVFNNSIQLLNIIQGHNIGVNNIFHGYKHDLIFENKRYFEFDKIFKDDDLEFQRQDVAFKTGLALFNEFIGTTDCFVPPAHKFLKGTTDKIAKLYGFNYINLVDDVYGVYKNWDLSLDVNRRRWCGIYSYDIKNINTFLFDNFLNFKIRKNYVLDKLYSNSYNHNTEIVLHSGNLLMLNSAARINKFLDLLFKFNYN